MFESVAWTHALTDGRTLAQVSPTAFGSGELKKVLESFGASPTDYFFTVDKTV